MYDFPRQEKLKKRNEIQEVFKRRKAVSVQSGEQPGAKLFFHKNGLSYNRIAFTFSRKFGTAAERNRAKRLGREAYRHLRSEIKTGYDLVLLIYPGNDNFSFCMTRFENLLGRAGLFNRKE